MIDSARARSSARASQRPHHVDVDRRGLLPGQRLAGARHDAPGRLVAVDAAEVRRVADRRADVAARLERGQPGRQRRGRAARGSAGRARHVPRVVGRAVDRVEALPVAEVERHVRLAEQHGAGAEQPVDDDRVLGRDVLGVGRHAPGGGQARHVVGLLDRHRHAVQRPPRLTLGQRAVGRTGARPRAVEVADDDRVERRRRTSRRARGRDRAARGSRSSSCGCRGRAAGRSGTVRRPSRPPGGQALMLASRMPGEIFQSGGRLRRDPLLQPFQRLLEVPEGLGARGDRAPGSSKSWSSCARMHVEVEVGVHQALVDVEGLALAVAVDAHRLHVGPHLVVPEARCRGSRAPPRPCRGRRRQSRASDGHA